MSKQKLFDRLCMKGLTLTSEKDWIEVIVPQDKVNESIRLGKLQEDESEKLGLFDNRFLNTREESLQCTIESKAAEYAVQVWGGGTARVTQPNEFHEYPDVGQVNVRHVNDSEDGLMIMKRDQGKVPIILLTGKMPKFFLMGWIIPDYAKQIVYRINMGREQTNFGFLQEMKSHECCTYSKQWLFPMWSFNRELIK